VGREPDCRRACEARVARLNDVGVYFLDEPEAALSFHSCLGLVSLLDTTSREGSQVIVATHSPLLVSLPGATLLQLGDDGISKVESYDELTLVKDGERFSRDQGGTCDISLGSQDDPAARA
jgi:predicted ATPase